MFFRKLFFAFAFLMLIHSVNAQFHIGVKAGVNAGKIKGKSFKEEFNYSYLAGAFAEIGLGDKWSINPEILFSQTTATTDTSFTNTVSQFFENEQRKAKLSYLSIPILINMRLIGPLHLEAGPQFGILMNEDKKLLQNGEDAFNHGDFSLVGGASLQFNFLRISARYVAGLSNVNSTDIDEDKNWKNQALQLSVGVAF
ncbi:MAG: porin family protein [Niabella sp.]